MMQEKLILLLKRYEDLDKKRYEYFLKNNGLDDIDIVETMYETSEAIIEISKYTVLDEKEQMELVKDFPSGFIHLSNISNGAIDYMLNEIMYNYDNSFQKRNYDDFETGIEYFFNSIYENISMASEFLIKELLKTDLLLNDEDIYIQASNNIHFEKLIDFDTYKVLEKTYENTFQSDSYLN